MSDKDEDDRRGQPLDDLDEGLRSALGLADELRDVTLDDLDEAPVPRAPQAEDSAEGSGRELLLRVLQGDFPQMRDSPEGREFVRLWGAVRGGLPLTPDEAVLMVDTMALGLRLFSEVDQDSLSEADRRGREVIARHNVYMGEEQVARYRRWVNQLRALLDAEGTHH